MTQEATKWIGLEDFAGVRVAEVPFEHDGKVIGLPFNLKDLVEFHTKYTIPATRGIYHLFKGSRLVYVGMSTNIRSGLLGYLRDEDSGFDNVLWFCMKDRTLEDIFRIEANMIRHHKPCLNVRSI